MKTYRISPWSTNSAPDQMDELQPKFVEAQQLFQKIDDSSMASTDARFQDEVKRCISLMTECRALVKSQSVFSKGEEVEDVNTEDLKYLLVEYYMGQLELNLVDDVRSRHLTVANVLFASFLDKCDKMGIMNSEDRQLSRNVLVGVHAPLPHRRP